MTHDDLLAALCFVATLAVYLLARRLHLRFRKFWCAPIIVTPLCMLGLLLLADIPYSIYFADTRWLMWLLGPTTVAFALPIYQQRQLIRRYPLSLTVGVVTGVLLGVGSSWILARLFVLPPMVAHSLLTRSISTPFALTAANEFGGSRELVVLFVMLTGIVGMLVGEVLLGWLRVHSSIARGASLGAAAHAVGTAKARELGQEEGAVSSLTMMFAGIVMVLLAPWLAHWLV
ncbi:LrgB family protein [Chitinimonas sp.]|uniref:LrgB family protein n=1 Tax=Chitinimonas sp. TaxID=1934313 RepID=UPI0035AFF7BC